MISSNKTGTGVNSESREMKYIENTAIGIMLFIAAMSLTRIYGNGIADFVALMVLRFVDMF